MPRHIPKILEVLRNCSCHVEHRQLQGTVAGVLCRGFLSVGMVFGRLRSRCPLGTLISFRFFRRRCRCFSGLNANLGRGYLCLWHVGSACKAAATLAAAPNPCGDPCNASPSIADRASVWCMFLELHLTDACSEGAAVSGAESSCGFDDFGLSH